MDEKARPIDELIEAMRVAWAERDALAAKLEAARVVLRQVEWQGIGHNDGERCPACDEWQSGGHGPTCALAAVLNG